MINNEIDFNELIKFNIEFKKLLKDEYGIIYVENKKVVSKNTNDITVSSNDILSYFEIDKDKKSIFEDIESIDDLKTIKDKILENYLKLINNFGDYYFRVDNQLDDKNKQSFEILGKVLKNRKKKLETNLKKFKTEDSWNIERIQEELYLRLQPRLKEIIDDLIRPIEVGLMENNAYEGVITEFNAFLASLGIYTKSFDVGYKLEDDDSCFLELVSEDNSDTVGAEKVNTIKSVKSYIYLIGDNKIICEGKAVIFKAK